MTATYRLFVDWLGNGTEDDITDRTLDQRTTVTARYGRDQARQLSPTSPGELGFELDNRSRDYSPENTGSPLAGFIAPGRTVRFEATNGPTITTLYTGYIDDFDIKPGLNDRSVPVTCIDALGRLRGVTVSTILHRGVRTGTAIGLLLDAVGWPAEARDLDDGASYLPYWWLDGADAYDALMQLVDSEGPAALVTVDPAGRLVFRDRHARLTRAESLTAQATWRSSGIEPCISDPVVYNHGWKEIVNSVSVEVPLRTADGRLSAVWSNQGVITVPAGQPLEIVAHASSPFLGAVAPVEGTDFTTISGTVSVSLSQTSGQSTTITLSSGAGAAIQDLQLRANAVQSTSVVVTVENDQSIARYGRKSYQDSRLPVWCGPYDAEAVLGLIVARRSERVPTISVTMRGAGSPARLTECLTRNLSDRVHLDESLTGLDDDCFVEQIAHAVSQGGLEHVTTFGLEKVPIVVTNPFTFDTSGAGFGQGVFDGGQPDDPATMFRFDTAGVGFGQGRFAH